MEDNLSSGYYREITTTTKAEKRKKKKKKSSELLHLEGENLLREKDYWEQKNTRAVSEWGHPC